MSRDGSKPRKIHIEITSPISIKEKPTNPIAKFFKEWTPLGVAILALVVSYLALEANKAFQSVVIEHQNELSQFRKASMRPYLSPSIEFSKERMAIDLENTGLGHAKITELSVWWKHDDFKYSEKNHGRH
jgi:hypothetical protein